MVYPVSITSRRQMTIPARAAKEIGIGKRALVRVENGQLIIEPVKDFLELGGSLKTKKKYDPKKSREAFEQALADEAMGNL